MWQDLPTDLQEAVWRTYFDTHVLPHVHCSDRELACRSICCTWRMDSTLRSYLEEQRAMYRENASECWYRCEQGVATYLYWEEVIYLPLHAGCTAAKLSGSNIDDSVLEDVLWMLDVHYNPYSKQPQLWRQQHAERVDDLEDFYGDAAEQDAKIERLGRCGAACAVIMRDWDDVVQHVP